MTTQQEQKLAPAATPRAAAAGVLWEAVDCNVLEDGRRLITGRGELRALRGIEKQRGGEDGNLKRYLANLPARYAHLAAEESVQFVTADGKLARGYTPQHFVGTLRAYVEAREAGELHKSQEPLAARSLALLCTLAGKAIEVMIDEACGVRPAPTPALPPVAVADRVGTGEFRAIGGDRLSEPMVMERATGRVVPMSALKVLVNIALDLGKPGVAIAFLNAARGLGMGGPLQLHIDLVKS